MDVQFDSYNGESFYMDKVGAVIEELKEKGLLKESDGAQIVDLSEYNMPPCLVLKKDGQLSVSYQRSGSGNLSKEYL